MTDGIVAGHGLSSGRERDRKRLCHANDSAVLHNHLEWLEGPRMFGFADRVDFHDKSLGLLLSCRNMEAASDRYGLAVAGVAFGCGEACFEPKRSPRSKKLMYKMPPMMITAQAVWMYSSTRIFTGLRRADSMSASTMWPPSST